MYIPITNLDEEQRLNMLSLTILFLYYHSASAAVQDCARTIGAAAQARMRPYWTFNPVRIRSHAFHNIRSARI